MSGKLIVLEGLDGSGKATQAKHLADALQQKNCRVRIISFPNYESDSSALVKMYLAGDFGKNPGDVNAYAASTFYAVDRYAGMKQTWGSFYNAGGILIADRYTTSNAVHQCCKLARECWDAYLDWLFRFEYELLGLPTPDLVLYLRVPVSVNEKLMSERYHGNEQKKDIHERDTEYLLQAHTAADYCAQKLGWHTVECTENDVLRSIESIGSDVLKAAEAVLG